MKPRFWVLALAFAAASLVVARQPGATSAHTKFTVASISNNARYLGAGSCSASACHNANVAHGSTGSEYTTWMTRDSHARAFEVLFNERSNLIQKNLQRAKPAHKEERCIRCHVAPDYDIANPPPAALYFKTDGVSCESCHGPARDWINQHHLSAWRSTSPEEKKRAGMNDTRSIVGRAQVCVTCHVGAAGMDVDHDLIAAGHPRLHFEFAAFHAHMPRHWPDAKDRAIPDFEVRAWVAGQLITAHAALELFAERAQRAETWPEFAEFDCAACHHNLQVKSPQHKLGFGLRKPGALPWGHQIALIPFVLDNTSSSAKLLGQLRALQKRMDTGNPNRAETAGEARAAAVQIRQVVDRLDSNLAGAALDRINLQRRLVLYNKKTFASSDELTQVYLGLASLSRELPDKTVALNIHRFDPEAIRMRLSMFANNPKEP